MQGMFGASVSELYLLVIEDSRSMCDHQKRNTHAYTGTVSQAWLSYTSVLHTGWSSTRCTEVMEMAWADDSTLAISIALL